MVDNKLPFSPVQGLEAIIAQQAITPGSLYFTTDTGKILLDTKDERVTLGGSGAAIYYASANNLSANTDGSYTIPYSTMVDQHAIPKADDLIINSDGRFLRVNFLNGELGSPSASINCKLIAVSGTGGGSGSPDTESDPKVIQVDYDPNMKYSFLYGTDYNIKLVATSKVDTHLNISYTVINSQNKTIDLGTIPAASGQEVALPVGRNFAPDGSFHKVTINITGANSKPYNQEFFRLRCINLKVENDTENFESQKIYDNSVSYYVKIYGQIAKTLHIEIDGKELIDPIYSSETESNVSKYINIPCAQLQLSAGVHTITSYLIADGIPSNRVNTDFIYHPPYAEDATYVIITDYPESCLSYETPNISYWVYDTSKPDGIENTIIPSINGANLDAVNEVQRTGEGLIWSVTGLVPDQNNICAITCNNTTREIIIYCQYSNIFDEIKDDAVLLLNANGRSNKTSLERRLQWEYKNDKGQIIAANLIDFNWKNNGWYLDDNNRNCLRVSNGAKVEIPFRLFTDEQPNSGGFTFEFEFKPYNLYSYNLLTQATETVESEGEGGDELVEVKRVFNADLASISYVADSGSDAYGVCCGTQDAFFRMSNGDNTSVRYMDGEIVNIAVTVNAARKQICMYVNGVMSGMVAYKNQARLPINATKMIINSDQCDLDIYNIRVYNKALTFSEITQNFIASKKDLQIYKENSFAAGEKINLSELITYNENNPDNATIPYIVFKTKKAPDVLPFNKANADILVDIQFVNPGLDYALALGTIDEAYYKKHAPSFLATDVTLNVQGTSSQKYPRKNFKGKFKKATSWKCINESIQDKELSKFSIRDGIAEKTFTWKADYMDSSSTHNTGFASFAYELYKNHPLDYYEGTAVSLVGTDIGEYHKKYRTSLFGFPVLAFHETSEGTTEFIGLYNFNLDKGADDTLGMALDKDHPYADGTYEKICECWEMANNMGGRCSFRGNSFDQGYNYTKKKYVAFDENGKEIEGTTDLGEDLEVRYHINGDAIEGAWENRNLPSDKEGSKIIGSEAAFNVLLGGNADGSGRTGAYRHLETFFKWLNSCFYAFDLSVPDDYNWAESLVRERAIYEKNSGYFTNVINSISQYREAKSALDILAIGSDAWRDQLEVSNTLATKIIHTIMLTENNGYEIHDITIELEGKKYSYEVLDITMSDEDLQNAINARAEGVTDSYVIQTDAQGNYYDANNNPLDIFLQFVKDDRRTKFENEFDQHLNMEYCMVYYIMTELLLQFDSRGKNMMFASWGPMQEGGDYVWFPIYYDIDTQLGVNNSGIPSWEYNVEPTTGFNNAGGAKAFSTSNSLLWQNFHASFVENKPDEVRNMYRGLRGQNLTIATLNGYYNFDYNISKDYCMKGILPISVFNANQSYKYIEPSTVGYVNGIGADGKPIMRKTSAYFYCLQGTRDLHRALFLRNRFNYYDSKWMAQGYQPGFAGAIDLFWRVNAHTNAADPTLNSNLLFHVKPSLDQYLVLWLDDSPANPIFVKGGEIVEVDLSSLMTNADTYTQQIIHIGGPEYIQEYGDVSLLYVDEFEYKTPSVTKIEMGNQNPNYHPDPNYKTDALDEATTDKPLLKVFDITNIKGIQKEITSIDLTDSVKLEEFRALGTSLTEVDFADGVNIQKLYLPESMARISLKNAMALNKIVYTEDEIYEEVDGVRKQNKPVMYIAKVIKDDCTTDINTVHIVSGSLKQYSYELLKKITEARQRVIDTNNDAKLQVTMEEVQWTPFTQLGDGAEYIADDKNNYYYATNNASFETYNYVDDNTWNKDILSGKIYHYDESPVELATDLNLLNIYIQDNKEHFTNVSTTLEKDYPVITGSLYINNTEDNKISEADLFNKYAQYYPSLDIRAKYIEDSYRARFVTYFNGIEKDIYTQRVDKKETDVVVTPPLDYTIPLPNHSVFVGWSLVKPTGDYDIDSQNVISSEEMSQYKFGPSGSNSYIAPEFTFYAIFNREEYVISFKDTKTIAGETSIFNLSFSYLYGDQLEEPTEVPYREFEESKIELTERITFMGWTEYEDKCGIAVNEAAALASIVNINLFTAQNNKTFYPVYVKEQVYDRATDEKYFKFVEKTDVTGAVKGYEIYANNRYSMRGKITIPATYNGLPIIQIGGRGSIGFPEIWKISHVFFMPNPELITIATNAFKCEGTPTNIKIKGIYLPDSITSIGSSAFEGLSTLTYISESFIKTKENYLPENITNIGSRAFYGVQNLQLTKLPSGIAKIDINTFYDTGYGVTISEIPKNVKVIGTAAFQKSPGVNVTEFGLPSNEINFSSALQEIGPYAFAVGADNDAINYIVVWDSVQIIGQGAFAGYGGNDTILYTSHKTHPEGWFINKDSDGIERQTPAESIGVAQIVYGYTGEV